MPHPQSVLPLGGVLGLPQGVILNAPRRPQSFSRLWIHSQPMAMCSHTIKTGDTHTCGNKPVTTYVLPKKHFFKIFCRIVMECFLNTGSEHRVINHWQYVPCHHMYAWRRITEESWRERFSNWRASERCFYIISMMMITHLSVKLYTVHSCMK